MDMKKVRVTNVLSGRFNTTITLEYSHDYFQLLDPQEIALAVEHYLNKDQAKPKINIDEITKAARDYGNILIHKGNQYNKDMKDNLLPFDLEEAKKDPSRIRCCNLSELEMIWYKPKQTIFLDSGTMVIEWENGSVVAYERPDRNMECFRLTPKRMFVNLYEGGVFFIHDTVNSAKKSISELSETIIGTFELIPVKEDE